MHIRYNDTAHYFEWDNGGVWEQLNLTGQTQIPTPDLSANWPVGSIFISTSATNPATLLGFGTWTAFGAGRVLVSKDSGQTEFDTIEETGGAKTHTLNTTEMPSHNHTQDAHNHTQNSHNHTQDAHGHSQGTHGHTYWAGASHSLADGGAWVGSGTSAAGTSSDYASINNATATNQAATATNIAATATNQAAGGGGAHNNLQPYIVVNMWKRTA